MLNLSVLVWLQQYLLRRISPAEYSLLPIVMSLMAFAPLMTTVLTEGMGRYVTLAYAKGDEEEVTSICSTMLPVLLGAALLLIAVGVLGAWHIESLISIPAERVRDAQIMLALLVFGAAIRIPAAGLGAGFIVRQRLMLLDMVEVGCQLLRFSVLFGLLFGVSTRVLWVVVSTVTADVFWVLITTPISVRLVPSQRFHYPSIRWSLVKEITSYGGWSLANQVAQTAKLAMDPLILNRFATAFDVASYYVGGIAPRQLPMLLAPVCRPFLPILVAMHGTGDFVRLSNTYLRSARYNAWVVLTIAVPAMVFSRDLMLLYAGEKYADAGTVMTLLMIIPMVTAFNALGPGALAAAGEIRAFATRQLVVHTANLGFTILFVILLHQGAWGAAAASAIAALCFETVLLLPISWKVTHTKSGAWVREVVLPTVVPTVGPLMVCLSLKWTVGVTGWFSLFFFSGLGALVYVGLVLAFGLRPQDRIDIGRLAQRLPAPIRGLVGRIGYH